MAVEEGLFGKYKQCEFCGRPLPKNYEGDLCPRCKDNQLFREVKHFIRSNNVNEYEVAAHFDIPPSFLEPLRLCFSAAYKQSSGYPHTSWEAQRD